jgi:hypothetical protein
MIPSILEHKEQVRTDQQHYIVCIEVVLTNDQRLPRAFYDLGERWTYLQSFIFRIARLSINEQIPGDMIETFDLLKVQGRIIDYCMKFLPQ